MKKIAIIYNPVAGKDSSRPAVERIRGQFPKDEYDVTVYRTKHTGDAIDYVSKAAPGLDFVVACGGDGTLNETVNGILNSGADIPVGYIPMGSTNDFASTLKIPSDIKQAVDVIKDGHINEYDVGSFNDRYFNYVSCFGPGSVISYATPQKLKNRLGYYGYLLNGFVFKVIPLLKELKLKHVIIEHDGETTEEDIYYGAISNSTAVAGMFKFEKEHILLNDGRFEVLFVKKMGNPKNAVTLLAKVLKGDFNDKNLSFFKADNVKIRFEEDVNWTIDGEDPGAIRELDFKVNHKAIKIYSPVNELFE